MQIHNNGMYMSVENQLSVVFAYLLPEFRLISLEFEVLSFWSDFAILKEN